MNPRFVRSISILVFAAVLAAAPVLRVPVAGADVKVSFHYLERERQRAMVEADGGTLESLLDERCTYTHSTGMVQSRGELIAMLTSGTVDYLSIEPSDVVIADYGSTVVVTGKQTIELRVQGRPLTSHSRYTAVWALTDPGWRCVAYQSTSAPE